jgi:predicted nucleotidyltransferase
MAHPDFEEFIAALNARSVRYLLIGAHALAFHARPRATKDLDVYVEPTSKNARRVLDALGDFFGAPMSSYSVADILDPDTVIQLGIAPVRIDVLSSVDGLPAFGAAWKRRASGRFGKVPAHYLSLTDLIVAKAAAARPQDLADLAVLRRVLARKDRLAAPSAPKNDDTPPAPRRRARKAK